MIFLAEKNLLFVKPHKTASTSVEIALSCVGGGTSDIITPLLPEDELKRVEAGGRLPQGWAWLASEERRYVRDFANFRATGKVPRRLLPGGHGKLYSKLSARYFNHMTPAQIRRRGSRALLEGVYLVSMVRHPYEQVVSWAWHHRELAGNNVPLSEMINRGIARPSPNQPYLFDRRRPDLVIRYERMQQDLAVLSDRIGVDLSAHMTYAKNNHRIDRQPATEALNAAQKSAIQARDAAIFEAFGYSY